MKKTDALKLIESLKDEDDINELLKGTDIESTFKTDPTLDVFKTKIESDKAFKSFMDSEKDTHAGKSLETWKTNNLQTLINDEVLKATGKKKTPEQIKMEELEKSLQEEKDIRIKAENTNKLNGLLSDAGLDAKKAAEFFSVGNMENIDKSIGNFKAYTDEFIKNGVKAAIADGNYTPPGENGAGELTSDDLAKMMM